MKKAEQWFADFETTVPNKDNRVFVYLWAAVSGNRRRTGRSVSSFLDFCDEGKKVIYFHNMPFDFSYIHYELLKRGITPEIVEKKGVYYSVKFGEVELRDNMNFMHMSLKEVGENYCEQYQKTSIDYNATENHFATDEEIEYCVNDCLVLQEGHNKFMAGLSSVLLEAGCHNTAKKLSKKLTVSSIAFEAFKEVSGFDMLCPKTTFNEFKLFVKAYYGGFVYSAEDGLQTNVRMIDNNSIYPFQYSTIDMPFGKPIPVKTIEEAEQYKFYIANVSIQYELKEGYIPIIGGKIGRYGGTIYSASSDNEYEPKTLCNTDLELVKRFYHCDILYNWIYAFETKEHMFANYCDIFMKIKEKEKGVKRQAAKFMLNMPYGKTAMNGANELYTYEIDEESEIIKKHVSGYEIDDDAFQYLPIAIAITAGARKTLLTAAESIGFHRIHYMDTDSIKFSGDMPTNIDIHPTRLGAWKDEGLCYYFKTISPKKYIYWSEGKLNITCAGFSKKVLEKRMLHTKRVCRKKALRQIRRFDKGLNVKCLQSKLVKGGRAILPVVKEIK